MKIAITGGIACGKSLLSKFLNELGIETLDADDVVHELIPADERKRLAKIVFTDAAARRELESRIHPLVRERLRRWQDAAPEGVTRIVVVPLLFETHWDKEYDIIVTIASSEANQIDRMTSRRGYAPDEARARLAAQMPVAQKAAKSHYVIHNDASAEELHRQAEALRDYLKGKRDGR